MIKSAGASGFLTPLAGIAADIASSTGRCRGETDRNLCRCTNCTERVSLQPSAVCAAAAAAAAATALLAGYASLAAAAAAAEVLPETSPAAAAGKSVPLTYDMLRFVHENTAGLLLPPCARCEP